MGRHLPFFFALEDTAMKVLVTRRLTLRPPALLDAEDIALWLSNWNVARMLGRVPFPYHRKDAEEWIAGLAERPDSLVYTVHRERLIGVVAIDGGAAARLGYWLAEPWHGRGFMTEAAAALLAHAIEERGLQEVCSSVFADNPASLRVQEKLGFKVTGAGQAWCRSRDATVATVTTRLAAADFVGTPAPAARSAA
jgi:RimJ/RimL family protein N-acetyltransferase